MDELIAVFIQEAREHLEAFEQGLLSLQRGESGDEMLNAIFRSAHTIKGAAGAVELRAIERFTHVLEEVLDAMRSGSTDASAETVDLLLASGDHIAAMVDQLEANPQAAGEALDDDGESLRERLSALSGKTEPLSAEAAGVAEPVGAPTDMGGCWHVSVRFGADVMRQGIDPAALVRYLGGQMNIRHLTTITEGLPTAEDLDPERCYLGFEIDLEGAQHKAQIEQAFDFVRDECELRILPPESLIDDYIELIRALPEDDMYLGEILVSAGVITRAELARGLSLQEASGSGAPIGEILVDNGAVTPEVVHAAVAHQARAADHAHRESRLLRVPSDRLDALIDLVGELVIASASAQLFAHESGSGALVEANASVARLVEEVRDSALQLRMVTIGETFKRFGRVVRDTARDVGKTIELDIKGADTELDKSVVERLSDPLMHLVRNAIDHGIENTDERIAANKRSAGTVTLNAYHDSGNVVIEVRDNGRGLNTPRIQEKAIERGLVNAEQTLSDSEIHQLIFEPGFSTSSQVTSLSGRGVGMDVVKRSIVALRGTVDVSSEPGQGTCFALRLPLTLAIIDGFLVSVDASCYVVPLDNVVECIELDAGQTYGNVLRLRGEVLPIIHLRELFEVRSAPPRRQNVVVLQAAGMRAGIVVDALRGEFQTVIKPLGQLFRHLRGISGSTIMGNGEVALIVDVQNLVAVAANQCHARHDTGHRKTLGHSAPEQSRESAGV